MRAIFALVAIVALAAAVFLADNPGRVEIVWHGWQILTSVGVLIAAAALAALAVALLLWLLSLILGSPGMFFRRRRERRRRAGYEALTRGMVAVAAGDPQEARRYARRAEALLAEPPLTLLLSAQAAQIGGDELAAKNFFTAMLDRPETEFLGLRGLLNQALREGDRDTARRLAARAAALRPTAAWAVASLFDLEARDGRWLAARDALDKAAKHHFIAADLASRHRGVILYELSCAAATEGDPRRAVTLAAQAQALTPDLAAPAAHHARLLLDAGRTGRARRAIERAWRTAPHPELAQAYGEIGRDETPLARVARFGRLAAQNPSARESHLALADAALAAQLWGEARRHLERALAAEPAPLAPLPANSGAVLPLLSCRLSASCRLSLSRLLSPPRPAQPQPRPRDAAAVPDDGAAGRGRARRSRPYARMARPRRPRPARPAPCLRQLRRREHRVGFAVSALRRLRHARLANSGCRRHGSFAADHGRGVAPNRRNRRSRGSARGCSGEPLTPRAWPSGLARPPGHAINHGRRPGSSVVEQPLRKR